jgi:hypothetical protein
MGAGMVRTVWLLALARVPLWGCANAVKRPAPPLAPPEASQALVTFLCPTYFGGGIQFGVRDGDRFARREPIPPQAGQGLA